MSVSTCVTWSELLARESVIKRLIQCFAPVAVRESATWKGKDKRYHNMFILMQYRANTGAEKDRCSGAIDGDEKDNGISDEINEWIVNWFQVAHKLLTNFKQ